MSMKRCVTSPPALNPKVEIKKENLFLKHFKLMTFDQDRFFTFKKTLKLKENRENLSKAKIVSHEVLTLNFLNIAKQTSNS